MIDHFTDITNRCWWWWPMCFTQQHNNTTLQYYKIKSIGFASGKERTKTIESSLCLSLISIELATHTQTLLNGERERVNQEFC